MISEFGHSTVPRDPLEEETTMLKSISAALIAVSVIAAPALAATSGKTTPAPVIKSGQVQSKVLNANACQSLAKTRSSRSSRWTTGLTVLLVRSRSSLTAKRLRRRP